MSRLNWNLIRRVTALCVKLTFALFVLLVLPDLYQTIIPAGARACWVEAVALALLFASLILGELAALVPGERHVADRASHALAIVNPIVDWMIRKGLVIVVLGVCLLLLVGWVPHYLTWPFSRDQETFAVLAESWDNGILPYRDIRAYNFPGATYLAWTLGKIFGWGHTVPYYAFDAGCVMILGVALVAWSRKRLGGVVPGLIGYLCFLQFYMNMSFETTGERDWHTAFFVCLGLLSLQMIPGRRARIISALTTTAALTIRPHAVLFLPALLLAVMEGADSSGWEWRTRLRDAGEWCLWLSMFVAVAFAPLFIAGIADDLVHGLRVAAYGGPYNKATPGDALFLFLDQFTRWRFVVPLLATLVLAALPRNPLSGMARTWLLAFLAALVYRPIHPVHHFYLIYPIVVTSSIALAFPISWLLSQRISQSIIVVLILLLAYEVIPTSPYMFNVLASAQSLGPLVRGEMPDLSPPGCIKAYPHIAGASPSWGHYRDLVVYLRRKVGPRTVVANVLNRFPYDTVNGPTGRLSPFLAESGICWMAFVDIDLDPEFAMELEGTVDSVVVWEPDQTRAEPRLRVTRVVEVVRKYYEPMGGPFGEIEVWKRKSPVARR